MAPKQEASSVSEATEPLEVERTALSESEKEKDHIVLLDEFIGCLLILLDDVIDRHGRHPRFFRFEPLYRQAGFKSRLHQQYVVLTIFKWEVKSYVAGVGSWSATLGGIECAHTFQLLIGVYLVLRVILLRRFDVGVRNDLIDVHRAAEDVLGRLRGLHWTHGKL